MEKHIKELSSIRGIAALTVVLQHIFEVINRHAIAAQDGWLNSFFDFLGATFNGKGAVEIFFVLSGLVLSLSLERNRDDKFNWAVSFYIRRIFRIYPALWISLILALVLLPLERNSCSAGFCTNFAVGAFQENFTFTRIAQSFAGLYVHLNGPMWSLRTELFYSLLFPILFIALRYKKTQTVSFLFILALAVLPIPRLYSVHYALAFAFGSLIPLIQIPNKKTPFKLLSVVALIGLVFSRQFFASFNFEEKTFEVIEMFMSFALVYVIFHKKVDLNFLRNRRLFYIGEISYSIYILHYPLLFTLTYALGKFRGQSIIENPNFYTVVLGASTLVVTLGLSILNFHIFEMPLQAIGRMLSKNVKISSLVVTEEFQES